MGEKSFARRSHPPEEPLNFTRSCRLLLLLGIPPSTLGFTCGSTGTSSSADGGDGGGTPPRTDAAPVAITPASTNVLTCSTLDFARQPASGSTGSWVVSPASAGSINSSGTYTAPLVVPTGKTSVDYIESAPVVHEAMAEITVATAFPGSPLAVPVSGNTNVMGHPFEHQFAANGSSVYAVLTGPSGTTEADVYESQDNGQTYNAPTAYTILGGPECAAIAVDPVNPKLVYLAYIGGTTSNGVTLRLAVSVDGAKTFPEEYDLIDAVSNLSSFLCPDVNAPAPNAVIVAGYSSLVPDGSKNHMATFVSMDVGKGIGPVGKEGIPQGDDQELGNDTNAADLITCGIGSNGGGSGPRLASNGKGTVCTFSLYENCVNASQNGVTVQCSKNTGATWGSALTLANPAASTTSYPTGAISPSGKVAVTWVDSVVEDGGSNDETFIAISENGGQAFGTPIQYPTALRLADGGGGPAYPVVSWENDDVLWLAQNRTVGSEALTTFVDKTCDGGQSWSGSVNLGAYGNSSLFATTNGMFEGVYVLGTGTGAGVFAIPLAPMSP
jgi:hypothetical protein